MGRVWRFFLPPRPCGLRRSELIVLVIQASTKGKGDPGGWATLHEYYLVSFEVVGEQNLRQLPEQFRSYYSFGRDDGSGARRVPPVVTGGRGAHGLLGCWRVPWARSGEQVRS